MEAILTYGPLILGAILVVIAIMGYLRARTLYDSLSTITKVTVS